ncbi:MAG: CAP domain-containing protein [Lachnospiraceae bacterium]|nr:CAP domain-containing protein [Lachnospiraceae bacterium]
MYNQNFKTKLRKAFAAMAAATMVFTTSWNGLGDISSVHAAEESQSRLNVAYHTQAEISARIKSDGISLNDPLTFVTEPQLTSPYSNAGVLSQDTLNAAMKTMNQIRYIAGLQDNVTLNEEYNRKAQAAALVNYANHALSHSPSKPAGMNDSMYKLGYDGASSCNIAMASWNCSLNQTIVQSWMEDGDSSNIDRVGHRRWILNPSMGQTGFGAVYGPGGTYSALYCFDRSRSASETQVAWPAQNMPVEYFGTKFPWSVSIGSSVDKNAVHVTLKRVRDGMTWNFSSGVSNGYFNVDNGGYGQKGCIIFRPDRIDGYHAGDTFEVVITGGGVNLSYTVNFFDPDNVQPEEHILNTDWTAANALIAGIPDGGTADILTGNRFEVPAETMSLLSGRNILCALHIDSDIVLSFDGTNVQSNPASWNVALSYKTEFLEQVKTNAAAKRSFELTSVGALPASVNIHVGWGAENAGKQAVLYRYDDVSGMFTELSRFTITDNGQSMFTIDGNDGNYIAVVLKYPR